MANFWYNAGALAMADQTLDWVNDPDLKVMLVGPGYTPDRDHAVLSDISAEEVVASGYTGGHAGAGRLSLTGNTVVKDDANDRIEFHSATDFIWDPLGGAVNDIVQGMVVFKENTSDADSVPIAWIDESTGTPSLPYTTNGGKLDLNQHADGLMQLLTNPV